jgi:hypothetical protein
MKLKIIPALTISVPEAGRKYFALGRKGSYAAAARGEIPTIRIGRLLRVPIARMDRMLNGLPVDPKRFADDADPARR